ncbi:MAG: hypothetical protein RLZZ352_1927 [Pseudomonadota bacterium]
MQARPSSPRLLLVLGGMKQRWVTPVPAAGQPVLGWWLGRRVLLRPQPLRYWSLALCCPLSVQMRWAIPAMAELLTMWLRWGLCWTLYQGLKPVLPQALGWVLRWVWAQPPLAQQRCREYQRPQPLRPQAAPRATPDQLPANSGCSGCSKLAVRAKSGRCLEQCETAYRPGARCSNPVYRRFLPQGASGVAPLPRPGLQRGRAALGAGWSMRSTPSQPPAAANASHAQPTTAPRPEKKARKKWSRNS